MVIYKITCMVNGKVYVGLTCGSLDKRWKRHCRTAKTDGRRSPYLYRAINKYGPDTFSTEVLEECATLEDLAKAEIKWIDSLDSRDPKKGYNVSKGGHMTCFSQEGLERLRAANLGKHYIFSEDHKRRISQGRKGILVSPETRAKISATLRGRYRSVSFTATP